MGITHSHLNATLTMKLCLIVTAVFVASMATSSEARKIDGSEINPKGCGDDCDSSCPNCFLGACFYFSKDNAVDNEETGSGDGDKEDGCIYLAQYPTWTGTYSWNGGSAGQCNQPRTMAVEDMSGDGSGSVTIMTNLETPGPCQCQNHNIDVNPCNTESSYIASCSGGIITMTLRSAGGEENETGEMTGVVSSTTLFIQGGGSEGRYSPAALSLDGEGEAKCESNGSPCTSSSECCSNYCWPTGGTCQ